MTLATYPDSTEQFVYTTLDLSLRKDRQNRWTQYLYNFNEEMVGMIDPQGRVTTYERCLCGALTGLVDANGHRTKWAQDIEGRTMSKTFADGTGYIYAYDTGYTSRLLSVTDPKSQTTSYTYNPDDTPSLITYADSTVALSFDTYYPRLTGATKTITATSVSYPTSFTYNPVYTSGSPITGGARVHLETGPLGSTAAVTYTYDELGRATGTSINSVGSSVSFDSLGRLSGATNPLGAFTYGYYGTTPRLELVSNTSNGLSTSFGYQSGSTQDYRLTDITNYSTGTTVLSKFDYTYNPSGTLASWQQQADSSAPTTWNYQYDGADQLLSAIKTNSTSTLNQDYYGYDLAGNRLTEQQNLSVTQATFNNLNQTTGASAGGPLQFTGTLSKPGTVTVAGGAAKMDSTFQNFSGTTTVATGTHTVSVVATSLSGYASTNNYQVVVPTGTSISPTYDYDGNLTSNGNGQAYTWDAENELLSIVYTSGSNSGNHTEFAYDAFHRRVAILERLGTSIGSGSVTSTKQFVWVGSRLAEERDATNAVTKRVYAQGEQIGGTSYYYTRDHLGSVREMVSYSGGTPTTVARYDYDPYGRTTLVSGTNLSDFQYAGYYTHQPSGLNLTKYRAYDPNTARWLSRDPIGEGYDATLYSYVWNDPVDLADPLGLNGWGAAGGAASGAAFGSATGEATGAATGWAYAGPPGAAAGAIGGWVAGAVAGAIDGGEAGYGQDNFGSGDTAGQSAGAEAGVVAGAFGGFGSAAAKVVAENAAKKAAEERAKQALRDLAKKASKQCGDK